MSIYVTKEVNCEFTDRLSDGRDIACCSNVSISHVPIKEDGPQNGPVSNAGFGRSDLRKGSVDFYSERSVTDTYFGYMGSSIDLTSGVTKTPLANSSFGGQAQKVRPSPNTSSSGPPRAGVVNLLGLKCHFF
ncbi:hypothetical protein TNCV_3481921 [Trichonephila clavipes]|nr:hypothetical protein TNCV_3481921 [Trichonephila clavipes]